MLLPNRTVSALLIGLGLTVASSANATLYSFDIDHPPGSASAGDVTTFSAAYNDVTQQLSFSSTIARQDGYLADGFWLVLSDGPNPKHHFNEYSIFYGDGTTGNLTSYVYNGENSANSWHTPGEFIQSFAGGLSVDISVTDEVTYGFSIDTSFINAYVPATPGTNDWDGASFAANIGIWYHPAVFSGTTAYNQDGSLAAFPVQRGGWYDTRNQTSTVSAPEPAVLSILAAGLLAVGFSRRKSRI